MNPSNQPEQPTDFERSDYAHFKQLELQGIADYRELTSAEPLTAERVVAFINQLSPWNLKTTGLSVLQAYITKQLQPDAQAEPIPVSKKEYVALANDVAEIVDSEQTEVGLRERVFNLMQLYLQCNLEECSSCGKQADELTALFQADTEAAVVEDNLAMLTYLMDEKSESMYCNGKVTDAGWICDTATCAVSTITLETERRKLIARLKPPTGGEGESV